MTVNRRNQGVILGLIVMLIACNGCNNGQGSTDVLKLQGAGASFPAPLYLKWFKAYSSAHNNVQVDYQSVGSGSQ
jgi:phosphate transport system substrate-binding protein